MFGSWLRQVREKRGLSQSALARQIGVTPQAINQVERGKRDVPNTKTLVALAHALQLPLEEVMQAAGLAPPAIEQLHTEGIPADVLAQLQEIYPDLTGDDIELAIEIARMAKRKPTQQQDQRRYRMIPAANEEGEPHQASEPLYSTGREEQVEVRVLGSEPTGEELPAPLPRIAPAAGVAPAYRRSDEDTDAGQLAG